jgi:acetolactate synthase-1/2/3 large subunit
MATKRVRAAEALVDILERENVSVIFGIPGGPLLPLYDQLAHHPTIRLILVKHEQAAAYAAFAYAKMTGQLGVCAATLGPGATNLLAGLPVALVGSIPILALTGQVQTTAYARGAHQESTGWFRTPNQEAMYAGTCKHSATCDEPARFADFVRHSIRIAYAGRPGPAHLIIPANLLHQTIDYTPLNPSEYRLLESKICDDSSMAAIAQRVAQARNPLILVGERALLPDATNEIQTLSERFSIPVITDLACKSAVDERWPLYLGCIGVLGHKVAENYLKEKSDLVLAVGQTFNEMSTLSWDPALAAGRQLIQLDTDPEEIGKVYPVAAASVGHLATMLTCLTEKLNMLGAGRQSPPYSNNIRSFPLTKCAARRCLCCRKESFPKYARGCRMIQLFSRTPQSGHAGWDATCLQVVAPLSAPTTTSQWAGQLPGSSGPKLPARIVL